MVADDKNKNVSRSNRKKRPPATTPEAREHQLISLAIDLAEEQLVNGTASSQVITHFLKLGSSRDKIEKENLRYKGELLKAQTEAIASEQRMEDLYQKALDAMRLYSGEDPQEEED